MLVYYVEGDRGHLMGEELGGQTHRWGVRGNAFVSHMPWEDVLARVNRRSAIASPSEHGFTVQ